VFISVWRPKTTVSQTVSASNDFSTFSRNSGDFMRYTNCTNWSLYRSDTKHTKHSLRSASMNTNLFFSADSYKIVLHYYSACYCISSIQQTASIQNQSSSASCSHSPTTYTETSTLNCWAVVI